MRKKFCQMLNVGLIVTMCSLNPMQNVTPFFAMESYATETADENMILYYEGGFDVYAFHDVSSIINATLDGEPVLITSNYGVAGLRLAAGNYMAVTTALWNTMSFGKHVINGTYENTEGVQRTFRIDCYRFDNRGDKTVAIPKGTDDMPICLVSTQNTVTNPWLSGSWLYPTAEQIYIKNGAVWLSADYIEQAPAGIYEINFKNNKGTIETIGNVILYDKDKISNKWYDSLDFEGFASENYSNASTDPTVRMACNVNPGNIAKMEHTFEGGVTICEGILTARESIRSAPSSNSIKITMLDGSVYTASIKHIYGLSTYGIIFFDISTIVPYGGEFKSKLTTATGTTSADGRITHLDYLLMDGVPIFGYTFENEYLKIPTESLSAFGDGTHTLMAVLDGGADEIKVTLQGFPEKEANIDPVTIVYDGANPEKVSIPVYWGSGKKIASTLKIYINGIEVESGNINRINTGIEISGEAFSPLQNGTYQLLHRFNTGIIQDTIKLIVINSKTDAESISAKPGLITKNLLYDCNTSTSMILNYTKGSGALAAENIISVLIDGKVLKSDDYITAAKNITIDQSIGQGLTNGSHTLNVLFDDKASTLDTANIIVTNSTVKEGISSGEEKPPWALTTITYEFYKDHPDYIIIPVKLNSATAITELIVGTEIVPGTEYELERGAIYLNPDYLNELDAGKYRVIPKFNDKAETEISNIQLVVYDTVADRGAPYLVHCKINFKGQDVAMVFNEGHGDLEALDVLALQVDDKLVLSDGDVIPFSGKNVETLRKAYRAATMSLSSDIKLATSSNADFIDKDEETIATPSDAALIYNFDDKEEHFKQRLLTAEDLAFYVENNVIYWSGNQIKSMNLSAGEHLVGAVFNNSERTMDLKKVILTIDNDGTGDNPINPDDGKDEPVNPNPGGDVNDNPVKPNPDDGKDKPVNPNPGGDVNDNPVKPNPDDGKDESNKDVANKPSKPISGGNSHGGRRGGNNKSSIVSTSFTDKNKDGSYNSEYKPFIPNYGGSWSTDADGNKWYTLVDGNIPKSAWIADGKNWYWFDENGKMKQGWYLDEQGRWFMLSKQPETSGQCVYGWYYEAMDHKWYFFDVNDGHMLTGWQFIDGQHYFFTVANSGQTYFGDNSTGWVFNDVNHTKPYGSMFSNEETPDGHIVNESGALINSTATG